MLEILTKNGWEPLANRKNYYTLYEYSGLQTLSFDISPNDDVYQYIANEVPVRNGENRYLIKGIDKRKTLCTVTCVIDMDEWQQREPYLNTKDLEKFQTKTLISILDSIKPSGWDVINAGIRSIKRSVELEDADDYDVLMACQEIFDVTYEINNLDRRILVIDPESVVDKGIYITPQLNLESMTMKGSSDNFATRITAYGKQNEDGSYVNFTAINDGKNYVEDNTYANKANPVWMVWKDERYTIPENLLSAAKKKLKETAFPILSFEITVNDLAESDDRYSFLKMGLYDFAHVIVDEKTEIIERVIKLQKYHDTPDKNKITLSNNPETIMGKLNQAVSEATVNLSLAKGSILEQAQNKATQLINSWAEKGHVYMTENEIYILDKIPKEQAKFCIRINLGGIAFSQSGWQGPYISAWTIDGKFNADFITAGTIIGIKLKGTEIIGGSITGETTINVGTDLYVGNNIYLGNQKTNTHKRISLNKDTYIEFSDFAVVIQRATSQLFMTDESFFVRFNSGDFIPFMANLKDKEVYVGGKMRIHDSLSVGGDATMQGLALFHEGFHSQEDCIFMKNVSVNGDLSVFGNKNRVVETKNNGNRKLNAVESASCYFTDEGQVEFDAKGKAIIVFDPIWLETVNTEKQYHIQLTPYCDVCPWIVEEHEDCCVIAGKPNTKVNWHVSAIQKGCEDIRLEEYKKEGV